MRQGPHSGEHCDILGNHETLEDIIKIATGGSVDNQIVSNIEQIAKDIREHPINAGKMNDKPKEHETVQDPPGDNKKDEL